MTRIINTILIVLVLFDSASPLLADDDIRLRDLYYDEYRESLLINGLNAPVEKEDVYDPSTREQKLGTSEFLRDTAIAYGAQWVGRWFYVRKASYHIR